MARRSDHSPDELRRLLLETARKIICHDGVAKLTVRALTGAIGYTPGTLYQHFSGIDDVIQNANGMTLAALEKWLLSRDLPPAPEARLHALADGYLAFIRKNDLLWRALFTLERAPDDEVPAWYHQQVRSLIGLLSGCFEALDPARSGCAPAAAEKVWASVHSVCSLDASGKLPLISCDNISTLVHDLVDIHLIAWQAQNLSGHPAHRV